MDFRDIPVLAEIYDYWSKHRGGRTMPSRADLDPLRQIPRLLRHVQLVESIDGGKRFRVRVVGTRIVEAMGHDGTGRYLDESFSGERLSHIQAAFRLICETRTPHFFRDLYKTPRDIDLVANRLFLPLSSDGDQVDFVLGAITFEFPGGPLGGLWNGSGTIEPLDRA